MLNAKDAPEVCRRMCSSTYRIHSLSHAGVDVQLELCKSTKMPTIRSAWAVSIASALLIGTSVVCGQRVPIPERVAALLAQLNETEKLWQLQRPDYSPSLAQTGAGLLEFNAVVQGAKNGESPGRLRA